MSKPTDTPKYIGAIGEPEDFYRNHILEIEHGSDDFQDLENKMAGAFFIECDEWAIETRESSVDFPGMSEIYVRSREVQKLVRAVDAVVEARDRVQRVAEDLDHHNALVALGAAVNNLAEARAALADIK